VSPLSLTLPGGPRSFRHLVLDFTGTLSLDGTLLPGVEERLEALARSLEITILTADTFGTAREATQGLPVAFQIIRDGGEKARLVQTMGPQEVIAIGNGRNDVPMARLAGLSVAVMGPEGVASELVEASTITVRHILDALDLLLNPTRLKATLRD
jgi:soluble P-type ATPase